MENMHNVLVVEKQLMEKIILKKSLVIVTWEMGGLFHNLIAKNIVLLVAKQDTTVK